MLSVLCPLVVSLSLRGCRGIRERGVNGGVRSVKSVSLVVDDDNDEDDDNGGATVVVVDGGNSGDLGWPEEITLDLADVDVDVNDGGGGDMENRFVLDLDWDADCL
jgi:hypothetical protein